MPYIKETCVAGKTIEVTKYYSFRWHCKGEKREPKENETSEAVKKINQRNAAKNLRRLLNTNFIDNDYLVTLDFHNKPTGSEEMQPMIQKAIRKLKKEFEKAGQELKYVYVKEIGPKGSRHIHMVMNSCDQKIIKKCWPHGGIHVRLLTSNGQYSDLANYLIKEKVANTEKTEGKLIGKRWYASRNLKKPQVFKRVISANKFRTHSKDDEKWIKKQEKNGYIVQKDSVRSGTSEVTGYEYFTYTLIKTDKEGGGG